MLVRLLVALLALVLLDASRLTPHTSLAFAADHAAANEDIWPSQNDVAQTAGNGKKLLENQWQEVLLALTESPNFVYSGCTVPASDADLNIDVAACQAMITGRFVDIPGATSVTAAASSTNHVFLKLTRDGSNLVTGASFEVNTTGTAPADSVRIARMVASGSAITSTNQDMMPRGFPRPAKGPMGAASGSTRSHEGSVTISSSQNLSGIHFYTDFTLNSGVTATVPAGKKRLIIVATGTITINGTIAANGAGGTGGATGVVGMPGTDQAGGGGGGNGASGQNGGSALLHGITVQAGGAGATGAGGNATQVSGSDLALLADALTAFGSGGGGGSLTDGPGGNGGASVALIAPTVRLGSTSTINTSGSNGTTGPSDGAGGGGAGNFYVFARSFTDSGATITQIGGTGGGPAVNKGGDGAAGVKQINLY